MKYLLGILSVLLLFFSIVFFLQEDVTLEITTSPNIYSYKKTSETEVFHIKLMLNQNDPYYFYKESIDSSALTNGEERIPLYLYESHIEETIGGMYLVDLSYQIGFDANDYTIMFENAYLEIQFTNNEEVSLYIGEFNYMFASSDSGLTYHNVHGTYGYVDNTNTVTGIVIELENNLPSNIMITDFEVFSSSVDVHNDYVIEVMREIDPFENVETILDQEYFFYDIAQENLSIFMQSREQKTLFCPLVYNGEIHYIHRFTLIITYLENNEEKRLIIDDFPFMATTHFSDEFKEGYQTYEID